MIVHVFFYRNYFGHGPEVSIIHLNWQFYFCDSGMFLYVQNFSRFVMMTWIRNISNRGV